MLLECKHLSVLHLWLFVFALQYHQPVAGIAYIGIIAADKLIGLSKYTRIAQWCSRRGTLQEELANDIAREIQAATGAEHLGVYIQATHGCCENRGIMAHSSLTQTTVPVSYTHLTLPTILLV